MGGTQPCHQRIGGLHLGAVAGRAVGQAGSGEVAVQVPLQIADGVGGQQRADLVEQVVRRGRPGDVEHQLVARGDQRPALQLQCPVGAGAEQVAVGVDHLRLHPQAELHAQPVDMGHQRAQTIGELAGVGPPVAQRGAVVVAAVEPAVVDDETLHAHGGGGIGQFHHLGGLQVEVEAFPGVQVHRARPHGAAGPGDALAQRSVEVGGQAVQPLGAAAGQQLRALQLRTRRQPHLARRQPFAELPLVLGIGQPFDGLLAVARPGQVGAVDQAGIAGGARRGDHRAGKAVLRGAAAPVLAPPQAARQRVGHGHELVHVLAGEAAHAVAAAGQRQRAGGQPLHVQHIGAGVGQRALQCQHVAGGVERDGQAQRDLRHRVGQVQHQGAARRHPFHRAGAESLRELLAAAVGQQRALAEPADAEGGRSGQRLVEVEHEAGQRPAVAQRRTRRGAIRQAWAPVAPDRCFVGMVLQHQAGVASVQDEEFSRRAGRGRVRHGAGSRSVGQAAVGSGRSVVSAQRGRAWSSASNRCSALAGRRTGTRCPGRAVVGPGAFTTQGAPGVPLSRYR